MKCLYIDTSSNFLYSAISNNGKLLTSTSEELDHDLSKITLVKISNMFKEINMKPQDIDKIIVVNGPGSFTGIRVGITIAKVYAWGLLLMHVEILFMQLFMIPLITWYWNLNTLIWIY